MVDVILVEESLTESALACIAIALRRPATRVAEARNVAEARRLLERQSGGKVLVILCPEALRGGLDALLGAAASRGTVVGFAADLGESARQRAMRAGVQAIYEKPAEWKEYVCTVDSILSRWLVAPDGASRQ